MRPSLVAVAPAMRNQRPINLNLFSISFPLPALLSISHRLSGALLFIAIAPLLYLLDRSLGSPEGFAAVAALAGAGWFRFAAWLALTALAYHFIAGCKHLLLDLGIGESQRGGLMAACLTLLLAALAAVALGVWLW